MAKAVATVEEVEPDQDGSTVRHVRTIFFSRTFLLIMSFRSRRCLGLSRNGRMRLRSCTGRCAILPSRYKREAHACSQVSWNTSVNLCLGYSKYQKKVFPLAPLIDLGSAG